MPTVEAIGLSGVPVLLEDCEAVGDVMAQIAIACNRFATHIVVVDPASGRKMQADEDIQLPKVEFVVLNEEDTKADIESCKLNLRLHAAQSDQSACSTVFEMLRELATEPDTHASSALLEVLKCKKGKWREAALTLTRLVDANIHLIAVSKTGDAEAVEVLLSSRANVDSAHTGTALMVATCHGNAEVAQRLLSAKADVDSKDTLGCTALMIASASGLAEIVQILLSAGANANCKTEMGFTALMEASRLGNAEIVQKLLYARADVSCKDGLGGTAIMAASANGRVDIVQILLSAIGHVR